MVEAGRLVVTVPDYALCIHTRAGQELGRGLGLGHWWENGARVHNESPTSDHTYRDTPISWCPADGTAS